METIFSFFESLFKNFTWGRFTFVIFLTISIICSLIFFEAYTSHFKLKRITEELKVIEAIIELEKKVSSTQENSPGKKYFIRVMSESEKNPIEFNFQPSFSSHKFERIFFQSLPWLMLLVLVFATTKEGRGSTIAGVIVIGSPCIVLGYNLPMFEKTWVVNYLYPWGTLVLIMVLILILQKQKKAH